MLSRRWIINYVLIFLIILFTYIGNRYDVKPGFQAQRRITTLTPANIDSVEIKTADASLSLQRDTDGWSITAPIRWPADDGNVGRVLDIVNSETDSHLDAGDIDLATLGLEFPKARLDLNDTRLLFGATNNIGNRRYVMVDSTVYLLPDAHLPFISQGLPGVVDRRLLPRGSGLDRLELSGIVISRASDGGWRANAPGNYGDRLLDRLMGNWIGLPASRVRVFRGAGTPRQKILAHLDDGRELEYFLMSIDPEIVIANLQNGLQYHFSADLYYQLISLRADENPA